MYTNPSPMSSPMSSPRSTTSVRAQPRCSLCNQTGHNRRTCTHGKCKTQVVKLFKKEIMVSKMLPKKPEPQKHNCPICCFDIETEKDSMCLPCGHHFHVTCGLKWLQENNTCPCCRAECGEKPKKLPLLNSQVAAALTGELLSSSNMVLDMSQQNQAICEQPWNYPGYSRYLNERERAAFQASMGSSSENDRDYTEEQLKENWNDETQATQIRLKCRFLYQHNVESLSRFMLHGFTSARAYQEGDFDLSAVLVNQPETGLVVALPYAPTEDELNQQEEDEEENENDSMPSLVSDDETDSDDEEDIDQMEENISNIFSNPEEFNTVVNGELDLGLSDVLGDDASRILDPPMTLDELETPLTAQTILDEHFQGEEYNAGGDQDITEEEALEIVEVLTTPEPTPIQVPNAPSRRRMRRNRSHVQSPPPSPRSVSDQHVTRRSSARLRQRYRRRRLQEENESINI